MPGRRSLLQSIAVAALIGFVAPALGQEAATQEASSSIRHVLMAMFDRPEHRLTVDPVVIEGDIAVAGWAQGDMGGRALMRRHGDSWRIVLCSGDALRQAKALEQFGLSPQEASRMAAAVVEAEGKLAPALVEKFSRFDGVVRMDEGGNHPPRDAHGDGHNLPAAHGTVAPNH